MQTLTPAQQTHLENVARAAAEHSYSPYSKFPVGAAVLAGSGEIYSGCNIENASYSLCQCAERNAISSAVAAGERTIRCVAIYTPTLRPTAPCGACRQVMNEFGPAARILAFCDSPERIDTTLETLLPHAFGPTNLA
jgi:cytidine deaminase